MLRRLGYEDLARAMETWNRGNHANEKFMESQRPAEPSPGNPIIQTVRVPRGRPQIGIMEQNIGKIRSEAPYGRAAIDVKLNRLLPASGLIYES